MQLDFYRQVFVYICKQNGMVDNMYVINEVQDEEASNCQ